MRLTIDEHFLYAFANGLQSVLQEKLGLYRPDAAEKCTSYVSEHPSIVERRNGLNEKKELLERVQMVLVNFGL